MSAEHTEAAVWTAEQLAAFLASVRSDRLLALWRLLAMTGMRCGEALGLRCEDIDMEQGCLSIGGPPLAFRAPHNGRDCAGEPECLWDAGGGIGWSKSDVHRPVVSPSAVAIWPQRELV
jgi:hypothetical protein